MLVVMSKQVSANPGDGPLRNRRHDRYDRRREWSLVGLHRELIQPGVDRSAADPCLSRAHRALLSRIMCAPSFRVNVPEHEALATRFATSGADKFAGGEFSRGADGLPIPPTTLVSPPAATRSTRPPAATTRF
jgi:hypothetical protein